MDRHSKARMTWIMGLAALLLASHFGLISSGVYLLSGAVCTLGALALSRQSNHGVA